MRLMRSPQRSRRSRVLATVLAPAAAAVVASLVGGVEEAHAQRAMGLDTSSVATGGVAPSQSLWNNAFSQGYRFAWVRSSRGGLTAAEQRFDDPAFYDNVSRGTTAGLLMGSYHFARPDLATTASPPGTNTAVGDADHYLQQAGMYMKPGYLLPVFDLEDGDAEHSTTSLTNWSIDFLNRIEQMTGVVPIVYSNGSYINDQVSPAIAWHNVDTTAPIQHSNPRTYQWLARPGSNGQTGNPPPAASFPNPYGGFDPNFNTPLPASPEPAVKPWAF